MGHEVFFSKLSISRTPHESLPLKTGAFRQFFRLVTSQVSLWYADHSTPNPLGVKPDPAITKIVRGNKFSKKGVEIAEGESSSVAKHLKDSALNKTKMKELRARGLNKMDIINGSEQDLKS